MKKKYKLLLLAASVLLILVLLVAWENLTVALTSYTVEESELPSSFDGYRIAHVSDLHNSFLWTKAIERLKTAEPDIICITGDIVDSHRTDVDAALAFTAEAVKLAPCYYVAGNHELLLNASDYDRLIIGLKAQGVTVLDNEAVVLGTEGDCICIAGISWGSSLYLGDMSQHEEYTVLLAHGPEDFASYASCGYELVLSGHAHGGQFRLPLLGGLYAPGQGFFPEYDSGVYSCGCTDMIVSRGVGNSIIPVRIFNRPEVSLIELKCP